MTEWCQPHRHKEGRGRQGKGGHERESLAQWCDCIATLDYKIIVADDINIAVVLIEFWPHHAACI